MVRVRIDLIMIPTRWERELQEKNVDIIRLGRNFWLSGLKIMDDPFINNIHIQQENTYLNSVQGLVKASKIKCTTAPKKSKTSDIVPNLVLHIDEDNQNEEINSKYDSDDQRIVKILMAKCKVSIRTNILIL